MAGGTINKVILIGNLGADPDVRYAPNGDPVANLSLATSEKWKDRNTGEPQERTEWHRVVIWGKLAEIAKQYLHKGSKVYIEGSLRTKKWQTQEGQDRYTTEIVVGSYSGVMQMLDSRSQAGGQGPNYGTNQQPTPSSGGFGSATEAQPPSSAPNTSAPSVDAPDTSGFDDDIPF